MTEEWVSVVMFDEKVLDVHPEPADLGHPVSRHC